MIGAKKAGRSGLVDRKGTVGPRKSMQLDLSLHDSDIDYFNMCPPIATHGRLFHARPRELPSLPYAARF